MKCFIKVLVGILTISTIFVFIGCPTADGSVGVPDVNYALTIQYYIGGEPATGAELDAIKQSNAAEGVTYGIWFGHEFKLTQVEFETMKAENEFSSDTTVEEYIDQIVLASLPGVIELTKINSTTLRMNMDSISVNEKIVGIKFEGSGLEVFNQSELESLVNSLATTLFPGVTGVFSDGGKTFKFTAAQKLPGLITSDYMSVNAESYLVIDFDEMSSMTP